MTWKKRLNRILGRATGYELTKPGSKSRPHKTRRASTSIPVEPLPGDRLVRAPAFILCTLRSGSTLLRVLLNSHSRLHSPQELHFRYIGVELTAKWSEIAMAELGLDARSLDYLLWDRILHRELTASGKEQIVCKTPNDVFIADRLAECWPDVRFVFLLRHPAAILKSRQVLRESIDPRENVALIERYCEALEQARRSYDGVTVRYEELTEDPARVTQEVCGYLGVPWEAEMLDYARFDHGPYVAGLGDWQDKIKSGEVRSAAPLPSSDELSPALRDIASKWGYAAAADALAR